APYAKLFSRTRRTQHGRMSDTFQCSIDALSDSLSQSIKRTKRPPKRVVVSLEFLQDLILAAGPTVVQADFTISMMGVPIEARSFPLVCGCLSQTALRPAVPVSRDVQYGV